MAQNSMFRINQLAKDLGIKSKEILTKLDDTGLTGKSTMATLDSDEFNLFFDSLTKENQIKSMDLYLDGKTYIKKPKAAEVKAEAPETKAEAEVKAEAKAEVKPEAKAEAKPEVKPAPKAEVKTEPKAESRPAPQGAAPQRDQRPQQNPQQNSFRPAQGAQGNRPQGQGNFGRDGARPQGDRFGGQNARPQGNASRDGAPQRNDRFGGQNAQGGTRPVGQGILNKDGFIKNERPAQQNARPQGGFNKDNQFKGKDDRGGRDNAPTPKFKPTIQQPGIEKKRTGSTRIVDTRTSSVDLSKYDERLDSFVPYSQTNDKQSNKQKLKKQNTTDMRSAKNRNKEALAMEKMKKANLEKAKKMPLHISVPDEISVGELASRLKVTAAEVVKRLMMMGMMATVNQIIDFDTAYLIADELGAKVEREVVVTIEERLFSEEQDSEDQLIERAPVVCVMGHVDHGKTSLLDAIRHTSVTKGEAGGIKQAIGAYRVNINDKDITFLDTPGHEAFTAMRARGAQSTDIAILVVAADDGIMPQTVEAINHAKAAGVDIIVAINKMDKPAANPDAVKSELTNYNLVPEEWGGDVICVPVSALTGMGIEDLLESVLIVAEMKELKANPAKRAKGLIIESRLDKGRGPVATVLVQNGTLHSGDIVIAGTAVGRVRAMTNDKGETLKSAGPSVPVEIIGLSEVPAAGDEFNAVEDERMARELADQRRAKTKEEQFKANAKVSLDDLFAQIKEGIKELTIIVKADVDGSAEAVKASLEKISNEEVRVRVIHSAVGGITENDVMLAAASNAIIVGFNVRPDKNAIDSAERQKIDIRTYRIIYECIEEITASMKGMLAPKFKEVIHGHAQVRQTLRVSSVGTVAGCYVQDGKITRSSQIRLVRDGIVVAEDKISSLRRFKDDVKEVVSGYECGITLEKFGDIKDNDIFEAFGMEEIKD